MDNILIANIIKTIHIIIIIFMIIIPFVNIPYLLILHITFSICLMIHWVMNSNECALTQLEAYYRKVPKYDTLMNRFISPLYQISDNQYYYLIWISTVILLIISIYNLYYSPKIYIFYDKYKKLKNYNIKNILDLLLLLY
jgi:hypothetical protein